MKRLFGINHLQIFQKKIKKLTKSMDLVEVLFYWPFLAGTYGCNRCFLAEDLRFVFCSNFTFTCFIQSYFVYDSRILP